MAQAKKSKKAGRNLAKCKKYRDQKREVTNRAKRIVRDRSRPLTLEEYDMLPTKAMKAKAKERKLAA